jgi:hypothetical protein
VGNVATNIHVPDYLILPFGKAVKDDLQKISLSAVSANGLYFATDVPVIFINKSMQKPLCLSDFTKHFGQMPDSCYDNLHANAKAALDFMLPALKSHNPNMTRSEELFLDLYFGMLTAVMKDGEECREACQQIGLDWYMIDAYRSPNDLWRALLPVPELQLYVQDPLSDNYSYHPDNNFRVDYGFWDGQKLIAVEIDGAEPQGYARDIRRDRLLRRAGVDVIHILNLELQKYRARALTQLLPAKFFGYDWDYEGQPPELEFPF